MKKIKQYLLGMIAAVSMLVLAGCGCGMGDDANRGSTVQESKKEDSSMESTQIRESDSESTAMDSTSYNNSADPSETVRETTMHSREGSNTDAAESTGILDGVVKDVEDGMDDLTTGTTSSR